MRYYFARQQDDGRLSGLINPGYVTKAEAQKDAMKLLRLRHASKIVLIEVVETIEVSANVKFIPVKPK